MALLSSLYGLGLSLKASYYRNFRKPGVLPVPVISIGNLTLGGTGKTPAVISLTQEAQQRGYRPVILTRGYRGKKKETCFVSTGSGPLLDPEESGDEPFLMAALLKDVPVVKGRKRYEAGLFALSHLYPEFKTQHSKLQTLNSELIFILDDGFQHWPLYRDIDIVLIDAVSRFGNGRLFPEGPLREPLSALQRADVAVMTKADIAGETAVNEITGTARTYNANIDVFTAVHQPASLISIAGAETGTDTLAGTEIFAFAGIADTGYFSSLLQSLGARIRGFRKFRDHHHYSRGDIESIRKAAGGRKIITTEKDLVKIRRLKEPDDISALRIEFVPSSGFYDNIFGRLQ